MFTINHSKSKIRKFSWFHTKPATSWAHVNTDTVQLSLRGLTWCLGEKKKKALSTWKEPKMQFHELPLIMHLALKEQITIFLEVLAYIQADPQRWVCSVFLKSLPFRNNEAVLPFRNNKTVSSSGCSRGKPSEFWLLRWESYVSSSPKLRARLASYSSGHLKTVSCCKCQDKIENKLQLFPKSKS